MKLTLQMGATNATGGLGDYREAGLADPAVAGLGPAGRTKVVPGTEADSERPGDHPRCRPSFPDRKVNPIRAPISAHLARAVTVLVGFQRTMLGGHGAPSRSAFQELSARLRSSLPCVTDERLASSTAVVLHLDVHARPPCADKARKAAPACVN